MAKDKDNTDDAGNYLRKLTSKSIMGGVIEKPTKLTVLYTIFGFATGHGVKTSQFGDAVMFMGDFHAVRAKDKQSMSAPVCYLPEPLCSMLKAQLDGRQRDAVTGQLDRVKFAARVSIVPEPKNKVGYEYRVTPVAQPQESGEIAELRQLALSKAA